MNPNPSQYKLTHEQAVQQLTMAMNSGSVSPHIVQQQLQHLQLRQQQQNIPLTQHTNSLLSESTPYAATNLAPLLQQAKQTAQNQVQQKLVQAQLHQQQQQQQQFPTPVHTAQPSIPTQCATPGTTTTQPTYGAPAIGGNINISSGVPNEQLPPVPPMLDSLETEDGIYVDDQEFDLAQSRVKRWLELEAEISTLSAALRDRRKQREDLNKHIIAFMEGNSVPHFEMSKGNLSLQVSKHKQPLNQKWIASRIQAVEGISEEKQKELMRLIFEEREVTEKTKLKHLKNRKK